MRGALHVSTKSAISTAAVFAAACLAVLARAEEPPALSLDSGWENPPVESRIRAYWWWLNGNVDKASITRDLEEMKAKGFGGALICDAGGATQDHNDPVPHGPTFLSPEWMELYRHALAEAGRLGLEMSVNIQSGWNLGGPMVKPEDAAKKLVWTETRVAGGSSVQQALPQAKGRDGVYGDLFVVAYPARRQAAAGTSMVKITASSAQYGFPVEGAADGNAETFWVSAGSQPGEGPTRARPEWLLFEFDEAVSIDRMHLVSRSGYGPRSGELQVSDDGKEFRTASPFGGSDSSGLDLAVPPVAARWVRLLVDGSFDPKYPDSPRNVQIAELRLSGPSGAWPAAAAERRPLRNWEQKAMHKTLHFSAPDTSPLFQDEPAQPGEEDTTSAAVVDLTAKLQPGGVLRWDAPEGDWVVLRFGWTIGDHARVSTCSEGWDGYALDVLDEGAFQRYWDAVVEPLVGAAGPLAGKTLKYLHTDSWEVEAVNWTPSLRQEFKKRRGYDLLPYLPTLAGKIVDSRPLSNRFLHDFRKTLGDLAIDHHYRPFRDGAHRHGLGIHPESGGPHAVPIDAQRCLGWNDVPMSEFWAWSWRHRIGDTNRFFVKQPASAAHTYGRKLVAAEGFTTIGPHWEERLSDNLKPSFDRALCEGFNLLFWHAFVCSPESAGIPGQQYFAGTHLNPNVTWWSRSSPFFAYLNRCQWMLQQGQFVADVLYFYGDHVPNFARLKRSDPAGALPGYDYDVVTEEALLTRTEVREGRFVLSDGAEQVGQASGLPGDAQTGRLRHDGAAASYRLLVLPDYGPISLPVLRKVRAWVKAGGAVLGPMPREASGLQGLPDSDREVSLIVNELWHGGLVATGGTARAWLGENGVPPDFSFTADGEPADIDYIHRRSAAADVYFVANSTSRWVDARCTFRVEGRSPELWDPVSGERRGVTDFTSKEGRATVPLRLPPFGSMFVVFREATASRPPMGEADFREMSAVKEIAGPWTVRFDTRWGGPASVEFRELVSWTDRKEAGVRFYSGAATYTATFELPDADSGKLFLDLGRVAEIAEVRLNGRSLGILWAEPFRVDISAAAIPGENELEVDIVNFWPNRLIGDAGLPPEKRLTRTNIRAFKPDSPLKESGLLGPVRLMRR
jgi:hypothetical protein